MVDLAPLGIFMRHIGICEQCAHERHEVRRSACNDILGLLDVLDCADRRAAYTREFFFDFSGPVYVIQPVIRVRQVHRAHHERLALRIVQSAGHMENIYLILDDIDKFQCILKVHAPFPAEMRYSMTKSSPTAFLVASNTSIANRARL